MDREKIIKGLECCSEMSGDECQECPYGHECLDNDLPYGMPHLAADALALLKEQEAVKPVLDERTGRIWLCGKCGSYVGLEDDDPYDPNEFDKYCRECGRPVLW